MGEPYYSMETLSPRNSIGYLMKRISRLMTMRLDQAFGRIDFTLTQWIALALIKSGVSETSSGLARHIGHDTGAMTRVIEQLVQRDLLARTPDPDDRRVTRLNLTDEGEATFRRVTPPVIDVWNETLADYSREEIDRFIAMLATMEEKLSCAEGGRPEAR